MQMDGSSIVGKSQATRHYISADFNANCGFSACYNAQVDELVDELFFGSQLVAYAVSVDVSQLPV